MVFKDPMDVRVPATRVHQGLLTWSLSIMQCGCELRGPHGRPLVTQAVSHEGPTQPSMRPVAQSFRSALLLSYC